ncbi:DUF3530 family protein [Aestuariibacter salexigens]|uniref:DUF3530 family protein n=1 Tax=Aestuariibacter salexigens TaxID=226010 RepID=UPI000685F603|nr:DUF3530 family protein [Aestuariibacter salexigens]
MRMLFLFICLLCSTSKVLAQQLDFTDLLLQDWRQHLPDGQFDVLLVGEQEVPLLVHESRTSLTKGVVVIISDTSQSPLHGQGLSMLVNQLTGWGWVTMQLPAPSPESVLEDEEPVPADDQVPSFHTAPLLTDTQFTQNAQALGERINAVANRAGRYPGFFLVISQGITAASLATSYAEGSLAAPDALVVLSPYLPNRPMNDDLPRRLARTPMPVLDLFSHWDNGWSRMHIEQRKIEAERELKMHYRQREIIGQPLDAQQMARVGKEIQGWLVYLGW